MTILSECRQALRSLFRARRLTWLVVMTLAVGVCGPLVVFSVLDATLLRPLPFKDEASLVRITAYTVAPDGRRMRINVGDVHLIELLARVRGVTDVIGYEGQRMTLVAGTDPERLRVVNVVASSWNHIGVAPWSGRLPTDAEAEAGIESSVALISHSLWQRRFATDASLPRDLLLDGVKVSVAGVMPPGFRFPYDAEVWLPQRLKPTGERDYAVFARMKPGESLAAVNADLQRVSTEIRAQYPGTNASFGLDARSMRASLFENNDRRVFVLAAIVVLLLSIACVNAASLLLARAVSRQRDFSLRAALGASRFRRARLALLESLMLAGAGTIAGTTLAAWCGSYASLLVPANLSGQLGLIAEQTNYRFVIFAIVITAITGVLAGLAPAIALPEAQLLYGATHSTRSHIASHRGLASFVVGQMALAFVLLGGGAVLVRQVSALARADLGFGASHLWSFQVTLPTQTYPSGSTRTQAAERFLEQLRQIPGVTGAGGTTVNPLTGMQWRTQVVTPELESANSTIALNVNDRLVTPGWFEAIGIRVIDGRPFSVRDDDMSPPVVVISRRLAQHLWPTSGAVGKKVRTSGSEGGRPSPWRTVIGVVSDVRD
ncbi:MAG TPA: ABC transporter permease, partial [Vicinamibacterales bacterium]|nr:ABC transporter permease [Vicinamibacterales bacterium]